MTRSAYLKRMSVLAWLILLLMHLSVISGTHAQAGPVLQGIVSDPFGAVITKALITLYSTDRILKISTDQEGRFAFAKIPPASYQVEISRTGFKTKSLELVQTDNSVHEPFSISLAVANGGDCSGPAGTVSYENKRDSGGRKLTVKVLDVNRALVKASVWLQPRLPTGARSLQTTTTTGEVRFGNLEPGQYELTVTHPGYHVFQTKSFWITRENQTVVMVDMLKNGQITICE